MSEVLGSEKLGENDDRNKKLLTIRFEYAWRYFEFHVKQRTTMFNFFLVFSGLFVGACAKLLEKNQYGFLLMTLGFGALITLMFIFLERRNEELVHIAEDVLNKLEEDLFKDDKFEVKIKKRKWWGGLERREEDNGAIRVTILGREIIEKSANRHGRWLPIIEFSLLIMYALFALYLLCPPFRSWLMSWINLPPS